MCTDIFGATVVRQTFLAGWIVGEPIARLQGDAVAAACAARAGSTTLPKRATRKDDEQRHKPNQHPHPDQGALARCQAPGVLIVADCRVVVPELRSDLIGRE